MGARATGGGPEGCSEDCISFCLSLLMLRRLSNNGFLSRSAVVLDRWGACLPVRFIDRRSGWFLEVKRGISSMISGCRLGGGGEGGIKLVDVVTTARVKVPFYFCIRRLGSSDLGH